MPPRRAGLQTRCAFKNFFGSGREPRVPPQIKRRSRFISLRNPTDRLSFIGAQRGRQRHQCSGRSATAISDTRSRQRHGTIAIRPGGDERVAPSDASGVARRATPCEERVLSQEAMDASRRSDANAFARLDRFQPALANCTADVPAQSRRARGAGANAQLYLRISCRMVRPFGELAAQRARRPPGAAPIPAMFP